MRDVRRPVLDDDRVDRMADKILDALQGERFTAFELTSAFLQVMFYFRAEELESYKQQMPGGAVQ